MLADRLGLDFFGVGEHHRHDFAVSAPEVVLAAIAGRTERIHLGSAVTVLSSDDPVRVFQRFATLDGLSSGRAEVILGRGSFIESFPLFGFDLDQYQELFEEKLNLFAALLPQEPVTWTRRAARAAHRPAGLPAGRARAPEDLGRRRRQPRVGRACRALRAAARARDHRRQPGPLRAARRPLPARPRAVRPPGAARRHPLARVHRRHRRRRRSTRCGRTTRSSSTASAASAAGVRPRASTSRPRRARTARSTRASPETVAQKIAAAMRAIGASRFDLKYSNGTLPHEAMMGSIERYATEVVPRVRELLAVADDADAELDAVASLGRDDRADAAAAPTAATTEPVARFRPPSALPHGRAPAHGGAEPQRIGKPRRGTCPR